MVGRQLRIIWTRQAREALKTIFNYYKEKSLQGAINVKYDILTITGSIRFAKQYQIDDINPKYRRVVVRHYKILYTETGNTVRILDIISTLQDPAKLRSK